MIVMRMNRQLKKVFPTHMLATIPVKETISNLYQKIAECVQLILDFIRSQYSFRTAFNVYGIPAPASYAGKHRPPMWSIIFMTLVTIPVIIDAVIVVVNNALYDNDDVRFYFHDFGRTMGDAGDMILILRIVY